MRPFVGKSEKSDLLEDLFQTRKKIVFNPADQKLVNFRDELPEVAEDAFGKAAHAIIEPFM